MNLGALAKQILENDGTIAKNGDVYEVTLTFEVTADELDVLEGKMGQLKQGYISQQDIATTASEMVTKADAEITKIKALKPKK